MMGYLLRNRIVFVGGRITDQVWWCGIEVHCTQSAFPRCNPWCTKQSVIAFINQPYTTQTATQVVAQLLALEAIDDQEEIKMYINSPGIRVVPTCRVLV